MFVEALVAEPAVERFDVGVLVRLDLWIFSRLDPIVLEGRLVTLKSGVGTMVLETGGWLAISAAAYLPRVPVVSAFK
jgi:hypothetical protein